MSAIVYQRIQLLSDTVLRPNHPETSAVYGTECCGTNCETKRAMHCTCLSCHCIAWYKQSNRQTQHHVGAVHSPELQGTTERQRIPCASNQQVCNSAKAPTQSVLQMLFESNILETIKEAFSSKARVSTERSHFLNYTHTHTHMLLTQYCASDKIEKNEMEWACSAYG